MTFMSLKSRCFDSVGIPRESATARGQLTIKGQDVERLLLDVQDKPDAHLEAADPLLQHFITERMPHAPLREVVHEV